MLRNHSQLWLGYCPLQDWKSKTTFEANHAKENAGPVIKD